MKPCPCGSGKNYMECCGTFIEGKKSPTTPEELMRSRYTAYAMGNITYIAKTMKSPAADNFDVKAAKDAAKTTKWFRLEIVRTEHQGQTGVVEFKAHYFVHHRPYVLHEISEFRKENDQWFYIDGK